MKKGSLVLFSLLCCTAAWGADRHLLTPEPERITDEAIAADILVIKGLQKRLAEINLKGIPIASYHFAKAQAWLDFAMDEYTVNDRSNVVEEALGEAAELIEQLEKKKEDIPTKTPVIPTSAVIRPDLWKKAETLKKRLSPACEGDKLAQLEVQLVWAGHEDKELGWRHAKPYLQAAERLAAEADAQMAACRNLPTQEKPVAVVAVADYEAITTAPVAAKAETAEKIIPVKATAIAEVSTPAAAPAAEGLSVQAPAPVPAPPAIPAAAVVALPLPAPVPARGRAATPATLAVAAPASPAAAVPVPASAPVPAPAPSAVPAAVAHVAAPILVCPEVAPAAFRKELGPIPDRVHFALNRSDIGIASAGVLDRIAAVLKAEPGTRVMIQGHADQRGNFTMNLDLSLRRADKVKGYLVKAGVPAERITVVALGKAKPAVGERSVDGYARNRRVEFVYSACEPQQLIRQTDDLQPERNGGGF